MTPSETDTTARTRLSTPVGLDGHGVQSRRIALFVGFAFTIAWAVGALEPSGP